MEVLSARNQALVVSWVRVAVDVNEEWRRHQMWCNLHLLVDDVVVGIANQRPVVCVKEHLLGQPLEYAAYTMQHIHTYTYLCERTSPRAATRISNIYNATYTYISV